MRHRVLGRKKWSRHIVVAVLDLHQQFGIREHRLRQIALRIRRAGEPAATSATAASSRPIPRATVGVAVVVLLVFAELQFIVVVHIDQRRVCATHRWAFRVALRRFRQQIARVTREARVNATAGQAATALSISTFPTTTKCFRALVNATLSFLSTPSSDKEIKEDNCETSFVQSEIKMISRAPP